MFRKSSKAPPRILCRVSLFATAFAVLPISGALAETCSVSPGFVNWVTPATLPGLLIDQSATLEWGSASTDIIIDGPAFNLGFETSVLNFAEDVTGQGLYGINFLSPVIHDVNIFFGNLGRKSTLQLDSGIVGDFNMNLSGGGSVSNLTGTVSALDNQGYFALQASDIEGIAPVALSGLGGDGQALDGRFWVQDATIAALDPNNGSLSQAYGMIDLAYTAPATIASTETTITRLDFRQVGTGVGPDATLGIQARLRSCIDAADDDFTGNPITTLTGGNTASVLDDDNLNTEAVTTGALSGNVDLAVITAATPTAGSVTLNTNTGEINVAAGTTPGIYAITYSLTDRPTGGVAPNVDTATATVVVAPEYIPINAEDDDFAATPIDGILGGTSGNAYQNDTIGLVQVDAAAVTPSVITPATPLSPGGAIPTLELSGSNEGRILVPPSTPAGIYTIVYEVCDDLNAGNCDQATIRVGVLNGIGLDFGDAPLTYGSAFHNVPDIPAIYMGTNGPDAESTPTVAAGAQGDDSTDVDDEDGIALPLLTQGLIATFTVEVTGDGYLQAWLDFDGDGAFNPALNEQIGTDLRDDGTGNDVTAGDGVIQFEVPVPTDATTALTYARFRFATQQGLLFTDYAADGEAEDYSLVIVAAELVDRGDAPASYGDPGHVLVPQIFLGASLPDSDVVTNYSSDAQGDDATDFDDEDGVASFPILNAGTNSSLTVTTRETLGAANDAIGVPAARTPGITYLQLWIDFDQDGTFSAAEHVGIDNTDGGADDTDGIFNNSITFDYPIPANAVDGTTFARLRWSTTSGIGMDTHDGVNLDGEVEDYLVTVVNPTPPLSCTSLLSDRTRNRH